MSDTVDNPPSRTEAEAAGPGPDTALDLSAARLIRQAGPARLVEHALQAGEGILAAHGALAVDTGKFTGRSPGDKFIVRDDLTRDLIDWGAVNQPISPEKFALLKADMEEYAQGRQLFAQDLFVGADEQYQRPVRVYTEYAWHSLFAHSMFVREGGAAAADGWTVLDLPGFKADPARHGVKSDTAILLNLSERLILVANTEYAGEIKKGVFSAMNFELPGRGVMPMHCSANSGAEGDVTLFFGLSGTGKTTLSADPERELIGDDEHGWSASGVFNFEGGCYAKVIRLDPQAEPEIFAVTRRFGTLLENVVIDPDSREVDFADGSKTENTRAAYPISFIPDTSPTGHGGHPRNIIFLTADAFGVLPPISRLSQRQAMYHFLSGYTAKVAGTERGINEPVATFSACFGAPFMSLPPHRYAELLGERLKRHDATVWLVNTGWTGGPYGEGSRIKLRYTRAMINAAISGQLADVEYHEHPVFGVLVPGSCPDVPADLLDPRRTWPDPAAYDAQAARLARMFQENFLSLAAELALDLADAGPR
jgi:phosphoenolpyruvate carboxykinase (ATP)